MKKIAQRLTDLVGNTPLLELNNYSRSKDLKAHVIVKLVNLVISQNFTS